VSSCWDWKRSAAIETMGAALLAVYGQQNERDYGELAAAARTGRIAVVEGPL
jgi:hypothetical protein